MLVVSGCGSSEGGESHAPPSDTGDIANADETAMSEGDIGDDGPAGDAVAADDDDQGFADHDAAFEAVDDANAPEQTLPESALAASTAKTTANLNLRKGPSTSQAVLKVIPKGSTVTVLSATKQNSFYNVSWNGSKGWAHSGYLTALSTTTPAPKPPASVDPNGAPSVDNAIARGRLSKGFSYYWGGGAWTLGGATASNKGSCRGSCPSCTHSGKYGADCSGMVAKAWQFGTKALDVNSHPYGTVHFVKDVAGKWRTVSRGAVKRADALVYNSGGAGHIVLWEKGDGWGSSTVYECRGCSYGCVYNTRSFGSQYKAIRRAGF